VTRSTHTLILLVTLLSAATAQSVSSDHARIHCHNKSNCFDIPAMVHCEVDRL